MLVRALVYSNWLNLFTVSFACISDGSLCPKPIPECMHFSDFFKYKCPLKTLEILNNTVSTKDACVEMKPVKFYTLIYWGHSVHRGWDLSFVYGDHCQQLQRCTADPLCISFNLPLGGRAPELQVWYLWRGPGRRCCGGLLRWSQHLHLAQESLSQVGLTSPRARSTSASETGWGAVNGFCGEHTGTFFLSIVLTSKSWKLKRTF